MKRSKYLILTALFLGCSTTAMAGNGYMGGNGTVTTPDPVVEEPADGSSTDGPLNDNMSESGKLFGDLYVIDRYLGGEIKRVPAVDPATGEPVLVMGDWIDENGNPVLDPNGNPYQVMQQAWTTAPAVGGEPKLTEGFARYTSSMRTPAKRRSTR